jgi:activator of 2-hydroxyglutaryl-CoA dehydratase
MLIRFDDSGNYQSTKSSTSCAASTGSFLVQQTERLYLSGIEELCEKALKNTDEITSHARAAYELNPRTDTIIEIGIDTRLMKSSELIIKKSMAYNTGQCLPINITGILKNTLVHRKSSILKSLRSILPDLILTHIIQVNHMIIF